MSCTTPPHPPNPTHLLSSGGGGRSPDLEVCDHAECILVGAAEQVPGLDVQRVHREALTRAVVLHVEPPLLHPSREPGAARHPSHPHRGLVTTEVPPQADCRCPRCCGRGHEGGESGWAWLLPCGGLEGGGGGVLEVRGEGGGVNIPVPEPSVLRAGEEIVGVETVELHLPH